MNEIDDDEIDESMDSFEAALTARRIELPAIEPRRICLALDGSNQDAAAKALAAALADQFGAGIHEVAPTEGPHFQRILDECRDAGCDLIVVPAPFREDFAELGDASIGTNLDMLLAWRKTPLLVVRDPDRDAPASLREIVIPLSFLAEDDALAAAWAFRVLARRGRLHLLAIADTEALSKDNPMVADALELKDLDESALAGLGHPEMAGLVAAVQRRAAETDTGCRVSVRVGAPVKATIHFTSEMDCMLVAACPRDRRASGYERMHSLLRQSRDPVLVV